jgi:hypothetical protein
MTKGADGKWSITVVPLNPAVYSYELSIDERTRADPGNPMISQVTDRPIRFSSYRRHALRRMICRTCRMGRYHINTYVSKVPEAPRSIYVYHAAGIRALEVELSGALFAARIG